MKKLICLLVITASLLLSGCRGVDWCTVITKNDSTIEMYDAKVIGWPGVLTIGGNFGGFLPVPDEITITWNTIKLGEEDIYRKHKETVERIIQENLKTQENSAKVIIPEIPDPPEGIFETHRVVLVLKGKVPKRPKNAEIVITYTGEENFDVHYIEKPNDNDS